MTFFEMLPVGTTVELGSHVFTAQAIKAFAAKYDPQPFHLDEAAAEASLFGGLCASGWHTASACMRLYVDHLNREVEGWIAAGNATPSFGPSPGFRNMRWTRPVFAGRQITFTRTITAKRLSANRPGWGLVETESAGFDDDGATVFGYDGVSFVGTT